MELKELIAVGNFKPVIFPLILRNLHVFGRLGLRYTPW
ncbi:MAG: hypothetical protein ACI8W8_000577 [Rhodothermales bacterium]|jgi:hypothetical protein